MKQILKWCYGNTACRNHYMTMLKSQITLKNYAAVLNHLKKQTLLLKVLFQFQNIMMMYMLILKILQWLINIFIQCFSQSFMLIMINLVLKIRFNLRYIIKTGKENLPVVVIPYVVIDPTKMGKSPINFERKVEAFEQRPIKVDEIVPFFLSVTV